MGKKFIKVLSKADTVEGQGVGSAYIEQVRLLKEGAADLFTVEVNHGKKPDLIHVHTLNPSYMLQIRHAKCPTVMYCHLLPETLDGSIRLPPLAFRIFKRYVVRFYATADYIVVVNPIFIEPLIKLGMRRDRVVYIPNFVSKSNFFVEDEAKKKSIRQSLGIKDDAFVVLGVGQVQTRKGVVDFIDVANKNPDMTFVWCGGFSFKGITAGYDELKAIMDNPPANVRFLGIIPRKQMNDMYNMANSLFMPSYNELFPMSILEAANSHTPILLRNLDLYKDILFGNYTQGADNQAFSDCLRKMRDDKGVYANAQKASQNISEFYSKEHVLQLWRDFYSGIISDSKNIIATRETRIRESRKIRAANAKQARRAKAKKQ